MLFHPFAYHTVPFTNDFTLYMNGVDKDGKNTIIEVNNFQPYFYIGLPREWMSDKPSIPDKINKLMRYINRSAWIKESIQNTSIVFSHEFMYFTNKELYPYLKISTNSMQNFYKIRKFFQKDHTVLDLKLSNHKFPLYESDIDPVLKLFHSQSLNSANWMMLDDNILKMKTDKRESINNSILEISIPYYGLKPADYHAIPKLIIASFDLECYSHDGTFPLATNILNPVIMIGMTIRTYCEKNFVKKWIGVIAPKDRKQLACSNITGSEVICYDSEEDLLIGWAEAVIQNNVNGLTGYNIFQFDMKYIYERACLLGIEDEFMQSLSYYADYPCLYEKKELSSSGLGRNYLNLLKPPGIVIFDLMKCVQASSDKLTSYKLDDVAEYYIGDKKHDISPQDIFKMFRGTADDRKVIAEYCIQDCALVSDLLDKLCILTNNMAMATVSSVPLQHIFLRGQGIKIFSLVAKFCADNNILMPTRDKTNEEEPEEKIQGAVVLNMKPGFNPEPVFVLDFAALYPSSQIAANLSHDTLVVDPKFDNLPNVEYKDVSYEEGGETKVCRWARRLIPNEKGELVQEMGVLPQILTKLLSERKSAKKQMEKETDAFRKAVLDGKQLALKITCNSVYGQTGAFTSNIYMRELAASTTALGRRHLTFSRDYIVDKYKYECIYGDTDSVFIKPTLDLRDKTREQILKEVVEIGKTVSKDVCSVLAVKEHPVLNLSYEKVFFPFGMLTKKRYIGLKYAEATDAGKLVTMGDAMKRRDRAPIVKTIYGGMLNQMFRKDNKLVDPLDIIRGLRKQINDVLNGVFPDDQFVITMTLSRLDYARPESIPHKVLADRIAKRDPGNAPQINDRIKFMFIEKLDVKTTKPGENVETPEFIKANGIRLDYLHYVEHQILNPILDLLKMLGQDTSCLDDILKVAEKKFKERKLITIQKNRGFDMIDSML